MAASWPICANLTFTESGNVDLARMLYDCVEFMPSSLFPPSYYRPYNTGNFTPVNIYAQFAINNLIFVDDITSQVTLDFYFRLSWSDPRISLPPEVWSYLNPENTIDGVDLGQYVFNPDTVLNIWLPDMYFIDATEHDLIVQTVKLRPNGSLYWSRHYKYTIQQAALDFRRYPLDHQNFSMRFQSYSYDSKFVLLNFVKPPAVFLADQQQNFAQNIRANPIWTFDHYSAYTILDPQPIVYNPQRTYSVAFMNLSFSRQANGVIFRLAVPLTVCLVVVGLALLGDVESRINVTLNMLLVTAALYLVIGQNIPFTGYLTKMDYFITTVFVALALTLGFHFYTQKLTRKERTQPLNLFYRTLMLLVIRSCWITMSLLLFMITFHVAEGAFVVLVILTGAFGASDVYIHRKRTLKSLEVSIKNLRRKEAYVMKKRQQAEARAKAMATSSSQPSTEDNDEEAMADLGKLGMLTTLEQWVLNHTRKWYLDKDGNATLSAEDIIMLNKMSTFRTKGLKLRSEFTDDDDNRQSVLYGRNAAFTQNPLLISGSSGHSNGSVPVGSSAESAGGGSGAARRVTRFVDEDDSDDEFEGVVAPAAQEKASTGPVVRAQFRQSFEMSSVGRGKTGRDDESSGV